MYIVVFFYISVPSFSYIICLNFANTFSVNNKNALRLALKYIYWVEREWVYIVVLRSEHL